MASRQAPPSETVRSMEKIITIFQRYAGKEGDQSKMSYNEFEAFMKNELSSFTDKQKDQSILHRMMNSVDGGVDGQKDSQLDFQEFLNLIGGMMVACHDALSKCPPGKKPQPQKKPPTEMEIAMESIIRVFQHYAGKKGDACQMCYTEFEAFMKTELKSFTDNQKNPDIVRTLMNSVDGAEDQKKNNELDFQEFMNLIGGMMVACHDALMSSPQFRSQKV